jgi:spore maturation protein CgeB
MNSGVTGNLKVIITGGTPDWINRNVTLRKYVADGFFDILGGDQVVNLPLEVVPSRVRNWMPGLVVVFGSCLPDYCDYSELRYACDQVGAIMAFWVHDDPYEFDSNAKIVRIADHIFSNDKWASEHYNRENVWHLPMAASPNVRHSVDNVAKGSDETKQRDVFFCGVGFQNRKRMLKDLSVTLNKVHTEVFGDDWDTDDLPFCKNQRIPNDQMGAYYTSSRIVLNLGRDFNYANSKYQLTPSTPGPRTFEAAMAGACQMMFVDSLEIMDYFEIDKEIVLFDTPAEFDVKLMDLLNDPERRARIGVSAHLRCLKDHTYAARARQILAHTGLLKTG